MPKDNSMEQINVLLKTLALMNAGAGTVLRSADVLGYMVSSHEQNKIEKKWQEALTHGRADVIFLKGKDAEAVKKELDARGMPCRAFNYTTRYGSMTGIVYPLKFEKEIFGVVGDRHTKMGPEEALNIARPEQVAVDLGGTVTREDLLNHANGGRIKKTAQVLDEAALKRYLEYAKLYDMPAVPDGPKYGKYTVYYASKDYKKANRIKAEVAKDEVSSTWTLMKAELEWQSKNEVQVYKELANGSLKRGTAVIAENGARLDITRDGAMYTDAKGEKQHIDLDVRDGRNLDTEKLIRLKSVVHEMKNPVILTKEEYKEYKNAIDKKEVITRAQAARGRPVLKDQDIELIARDAVRRELYEKKLDSEMPAMQKEEVSITNWAQDFWHFSKAQDEAYEKTHDELQRHIRGASVYDRDDAIEDDIIPTPDEEDRFFGTVNSIKAYNAYEFDTQARTEAEQFRDREKQHTRSHEAERDHEPEQGMGQEFYEETEPEWSTDQDTTQNAEQEYDDLSGGDLHDDGGPDLNNNGIPDDYEVGDDDYEH